MTRIWVDLYCQPSWGWILTGATTKGLCACHVVTLDSRQSEEKSYPPEVWKAADRFVHTLFPDGKLVWEPNDFSLAARKGLAEYFQGSGKHPDIPLSWTFGTSFQQSVWKELCQIPYGTTVSYGDIARRVGRLRGARAVGQACGKNPTSIVVPCHRVVGRNGSLGGFTGGLHIKRALLTLEGCLPHKSG